MNKEIKPFLARAEHEITTSITLGEEDRKTEVRATYEKNPLVSKDNLGSSATSEHEVIFTSLQFKGGNNLNLYANYLLQYGTVGDQLRKAISEAVVTQPC